MSILHLKSNTIADATGTLTVFNTAGSTETAAATNLVRPSDWNSAHAIAWNLGGNTAGAAAVSGTDVSLFGGNNITLQAWRVGGPLAWVHANRLRRKRRV